jgi:plasmid stabilization system protein ParE
LNVIYATRAKHDLRDIWTWNVATYGRSHADAYRDFLLEETFQLGTRRGLARPVGTRPGYSYVMLRRSRGGHGHVAVFKVEKDQVVVLRFFHTSEDWHHKL